MFYDFIDHPDGIKELLSILSKGFLQKLDYLQHEGLLSLNNDGTYVGSGGYGFTDELPQEDFSGVVRTVDMWGFTESQETVNVSPDMYEEFIFPYGDEDIVKATFLFKPIDRYYFSHRVKPILKSALELTMIWLLWKQM